jgi:hypothetical protein
MIRLFSACVLLCAFINLTGSRRTAALLYENEGRDYRNGDKANYDDERAVNVLFCHGMTRAPRNRET